MFLTIYCIGYIYSILYMIYAHALMQSPTNQYYQRSSPLPPSHENFREISGNFREIFGNIREISRKFPRTESPNKDKFMK